MNFDYYLALHKKGDIFEAEKGYRKLIKKGVESSTLFTSLGLVCLKTNKEDEGIIFFKKAKKINNKNVIAVTNLGLIYFKKKEYKVSKNYLLESIKIKKNYYTFYLLGQVYTELEDYQKAIFNYREAIKLNPNSESYCNLGNLFYILGNLTEAKKYTEAAIKLNPLMDKAINNRGLINKANGNLDAAELNFIKAVSINKSNYTAHFNLSSINNYSKKNTYREELIELLKLSNKDEERIYLNFCLGKLFENLKKYNESFIYFKNANSLKRKTFEYKIEKDVKFFSEIKKKITKNVLKNIKNLKQQDNSQIFIVGMPRSGTSLIEQILSSHSMVVGLGEVNYLENIINEYFLDNKKGIDIKKINQINLYDAGKKYIRLTNKNLSKKKFINKLPLNFKWIGLIKLIFPNSKIINCERSPLDTCFSIFQQNFIVKGNEYTFDLIEIGKFYNLYLNYMNYWSSIKDNLFYRIKYENIIKDQKKEVSNLLKYCSLNWEEKCLEFYKTKRVVRTSSDLQVRKKIYTTSVNKSTFYKKELSILLNILELKK